MEKKVDRLKNYGTYTEKIESTSIVHSKADISISKKPSGGTFGVPKKILVTGSRSSRN